MKILHTSDWHLGQTLITKDRKAEHRQFLDWLLKCLKENTVDVLIVAGDVFDSGTPPNYALQLYYNFLLRVSETCCRYVVIVGGNHDSVATLHAPRELLMAMNIHVLGGISNNPDDGIITIKDQNGRPQCIICAVPFLRDRDIRQSVPGESYDEKSKALIEGVKKYYHEIRDRAVELQNRFSEEGKKLPVIATGHLFTSGGHVTESEREVYVGKLGQMSASCFPKEFNYIALGHLHTAQTVGSCSHIRYSGSCIPLSFGEAADRKKVIIVDCNGSSGVVSVEDIEIPIFQPLYCIKGGLDQIQKKMESLTSHNGNPVWVEVHVKTDSWKSSLQNTINDMAKDKPVEVLAVKSMQGGLSKGFSVDRDYETLDQVTPMEVFKKRLALETIDEKDAADLVNAFTEISNSVELSSSEEDVQ